MQSNNSKWTVEFERCTVSYFLTIRQNAQRPTTTLFNGGGSSYSNIRVSIILRADGTWRSCLAPRH